MKRREALLGLGAGLMGASGLAFREKEDPLARFTVVDWQRYAVMTLPPGGAPPWRLRALSTSDRSALVRVYAVEAVSRLEAPDSKSLAAAIAAGVT